MLNVAFRRPRVRGCFPQEHSPFISVLRSKFLHEGIAYRRRRVANPTSEVFPGAARRSLFCPFDYSLFPLLPSSWLEASPPPPLPPTPSPAVFNGNPPLHTLPHRWSPFHAAFPSSSFLHRSPSPSSSFPGKANASPAGRRARNTMNSLVPSGRGTITFAFVTLDLEVYPGPPVFTFARALACSFFFSSLRPCPSRRTVFLPFRSSTLASCPFVCLASAQVKHGRSVAPI